MTFTRFQKYKTTEVKRVGVVTTMFSGCLPSGSYTEWEDLPIGTVVTYQGHNKDCMPIFTDSEGRRLTVPSITNFPNCELLP